MMQQEFTIDKVAWHTQTTGNPESRENIIARFYSLVSFLQDNGLTTRQMLQTKQEIKDEFSIKSSDLTDLGLTLMKQNYDKWLRKIDKGADPFDVGLFQRALAKLR